MWSATGGRLRSITRPRSTNGAQWVGLYIAGLLLTFETSLFPESDLVPRREGPQLALFDEKKPQLSSTEHCFHALKLTPLELLARACLRLELPKGAVKAMFSTYEKFLTILMSEPKRSELANLPFEHAHKSPVFLEVREIGHEFQAAVDKLFLNRRSKLGALTLKYALF